MRLRVSRRNTARDGQARWWLGAAGVIAVAAAAALGVLIVRTADAPRLPPPPSFTAPASRSSPPAIGPAGRGSESGDAGSADGEESAPQIGLIPPEAVPPEPLIDRVRVQGGPLPPGLDDRAARSADRSVPDGAVRALDRSSTERRRRVERFGGTARTEGAVEAGLAWLAAHQSPDGSWDRIEFVRQCPEGDRCRGAAVERTEFSLKPGLTGLATLAFLGAGYTPSSGPYPKTVEKAVGALLTMQEAHGGFGAEDAMAGYNDALATLALAECLALTGDARLVQPLRRAAARLARSQQKLGGWDYLPTPTSSRNDTSITAWVVQALQACSAAGVAVPPRTLVGAALHFARASEADGRVRYSDSGRGFSLDRATLLPVHRYGPAMTACGLTAEHILGWRLDSELVRAQQARLMSEPPSAALARGADRSDLHGEYYWYYGTVAAFQLGGEHWQRWNASLRDAILPLQNREVIADGSRRHAFGSWEPFGQSNGERWGRWGRMGGRVYTTAICTLTLEIYYRQTPAYLDDRRVLSAEHWRAYLREVPASERRLAAGILGSMRYEVGEPVLIELLDDPQGEVALAAALGLASIDSPLGEAVLTRATGELPAWERAPAQRALERIAGLRALPPPEGELRVYDEQHRMATLRLERAYAGMPVETLRAGRVAARMEVVRRVTGRDVVIARLVEQLGDGPPRTGDAIRGRWNRDSE